MKKGELGKSIVMNGVLAAFYFAAALFGLQFTVADNFATLIWPSTGIAFAAIFLFGYRVWPGIFIGAFAAFWITGAPPLMALTIALGNTLEAVLGAFVSYKAGFQATFKRMRDIIPFVIFGAIGATALSAFIGVKSLWLGNIGLTESFFETWRAWWFGNMLGALIFTPFILIWRRDHNIKLWRKQAWEAIGVVMFFLIIALFVFGFVYSSFADTAPVAYLLFLPIIWVAIRFGQREIATIIFLFAAVLPLGTLLGIGPFVYLAISESLLFLQVFMAVLSITGLVLATVMRERKETQQKYTEHIINEKEHVENILKSLSEGLIVIN
ncbi:MAG: MASE1 domain-containing protein, partial [bacterium]|nr:MASE1 domain-containing protein [bacterium]